ncbi:MAG: hypothetical protein ACK4TL_16465 [Hyphomicrobiaceae bacterium]
MRTAKSALLFVGIGLVLYAGLYFAAEQLLYRTGKSNPFYKVAVAERAEFDWVILGASHAMPLDFADFNAEMERETGLAILNLATQGAGPLYNRFVFEHFAGKRRARGLLYVVDSFGFYSRTWNEERLRDTGLLRRTPFDPALAARLFDYVQQGRADPRALLNYVTGFAKINNRERFEPDIWEGEKQFGRVFRPSSVMSRRRIEYLYPDGTPATMQARYLTEFAAILNLAQARGMRIVVLKPPLPRQFRGMLPDEANFDAALARVLSERGVALYDFSQALDDPKFYFDTDHLNRSGVSEFFQKHLMPILMPPN